MATSRDLPTEPDQPVPTTSLETGVSRLPREPKVQVTGTGDRGAETRDLEPAAFEGGARSPEPTPGRVPRLCQSRRAHLTLEQQGREEKQLLTRVIKRVVFSRMFFSDIASSLRDVVCLLGFFFCK